MSFASIARAMVSPPRCSEVASGKPSSPNVGTAKSPFGPGNLGVSSV